MRFAVKENFKGCGQAWEAGNAHDTANFPHIEVCSLERWRAAGWIDIDGMEAGPDIAPPSSATLDVRGSQHANRTEDVTDGE